MHNDKILFVISAVVILGLMGLVVYWNNTPNSFLNTTPTSQNITSTTTGTSGSTSAATTPSLSYAAALKQYTTRRIQLSINGSNYCVVNPSGEVFKKGTNIMLDNRYAKQITLHLDGIAYYIKGYGFKIITLTTSAALPHTVKIDCQTGKNNGTIVIAQ